MRDFRPEIDCWINLSSDWAILCHGSCSCLQTHLSCLQGFPSIIIFINKKCHCDHNYIITGIHGAANDWVIIVFIKCTQKRWITPSLSWWSGSIFGDLFCQHICFHHGHVCINLVLIIRVLSTYLPRENIVEIFSAINKEIFPGTWVCQHICPELCRPLLQYGDKKF